MASTITTKYIRRVLPLTAARLRLFAREGPKYNAGVEIRHSRSWEVKIKCISTPVAFKGLRMEGEAINESVVHGEEQGVN